MSELSIVTAWKHANPHEAETLQGKARMEHFTKWVDDLFWRVNGMLRDLRGLAGDEKDAWQFEGDGRPVAFDPPTAKELAVLDPIEAAKRLGVRP